MFLHPYVPESATGDGLLYDQIRSWLKGPGENFPAIYPILAFVLLYIQALLLNLLVNRYKLVAHPNSLLALSYLIITSLLPEWNYFSAALLLNTILVILLLGFLEVYNQSQGTNGRIFNLGLLIGLGSFLLFPSLLLVVWAITALMIMRPFRLKEWFVCFFGVTTPYYFVGLYLFFTNSFSWEKIFPGFSIDITQVKPSLWLAGAAFLLVVPFFFGGYFSQNNLRKMLIQVRKLWSLILLMLLTVVLVSLFTPAPDFRHWVMVAVPFAAFHTATYYYPGKRIFPELLFWLSVIFVVAYQYYGPGW